MGDKRVIFSGDDITTTDGYCEGQSYTGCVVHGYGDGSVIADIWEPDFEEDVFGVTLEPDEWESVNDD